LAWPLVVEVEVLVGEICLLGLETVVVLVPVMCSELDTVETVEDETKVVVWAVLVEGLVVDLGCIAIIRWLGFLDGNALETIGVPGKRSCAESEILIELIVAIAVKCWVIVEVVVAAVVVGVSGFVFDATHWFR
jgi:hypothetical protein